MNTNCELKNHILFLHQKRRWNITQGTAEEIDNHLQNIINKRLYKIMYGDVWNYDFGDDLKGLHHKYCVDLAHFDEEKISMLKLNKTNIDYCIKLVKNFYNINVKQKKSKERSQEGLIYYFKTILDKIEYIICFRDKKEFKHHNMEYTDEPYYLVELKKYDEKEKEFKYAIDFIYKFRKNELQKLINNTNQ